MHRGQVSEVRCAMDLDGGKRKAQACIARRSGCPEPMSEMRIP